MNCKYIIINVLINYYYCINYTKSRVKKSLFYMATGTIIFIGLQIQM